MSLREVLQRMGKSAQRVFAVREPALAVVFVAFHHRLYLCAWSVCRLGIRDHTQVSAFFSSACERSRRPALSSCAEADLDELGLPRASTFGAKMLNCLVVSPIFIIFLEAFAWNRFALVHRPEHLHAG